MAKKRKRDSQPINAIYLRSVIKEHYCCSTSQFAEKANVARTTIYNALRGKPLDNLTIAQLCQQVVQIDRDQLTSITLPLPPDEPAKKTDGKPSRPTILTLVSIRGGVGKTLVAVSTAAELATKYRVALVDIDLFTFGATRWFDRALQSAKTPLTFLDIALGSKAGESTRQVFSCESEEPMAPGDEGELFYIPSHAPVSDASQGTKARPILVNWTLADAQDAIDLLIERLSELRVDVIVLDTHPGMMALTDVVCKEADCNILVSDCDASTLQANWLLAWEIQHRQQQDRPKDPSCDKPVKNAWRFALNRIPSPRTVEDCQNLVVQAGQSAQQSWPNKGSEQTIGSEESDPVFLLPELEAMRLDELESYAPTSIKRRGGNRTALATKNLVRRLASEGILPQAEAPFPYASAENQIAGQKLRTHIENFGSPWFPGWRRFSTGNIAALASLFVVFIAHNIGMGGALDHQQKDAPPSLILMATSFLIVCLMFLIIIGVLREAIRECRSICWFWDACAINEYPAESQRRIYDAGVYPRLAYSSNFFLLFIFLVAIAPTAGHVGLLFEDFEPWWQNLLHGTMIVMLVTGLWSAPGKRCVFRVLWLGFSALLQRLFRRRDSALAESSGPEKW